MATMAASLKRGRAVDTAVQVIKGALGDRNAAILGGTDALIQIFAGWLRLLPVGGANTWGTFRPASRDVGRVPGFQYG